MKWPSLIAAISAIVLGSIVSSCGNQRANDASLIPIQQIDANGEFGEVLFVPYTEATAQESVRVNLDKATVEQSAVGINSMVKPKTSAPRHPNCSCGSGDQCFCVSPEAIWPCGCEAPPPDPNNP